MPRILEGVCDFPQKTTGFRSPGSGCQCRWVPALEWLHPRTLVKQAACKPTRFSVTVGTLTIRSAPRFQWRSPRQMRIMPAVMPTGAPTRENPVVRNAARPGTEPDASSANPAAAQAEIAAPVSPRMPQSLRVLPAVCGAAALPVLGAARCLTDAAANSPGDRILNHITR